MLRLRQIWRDGKVVILFVVASIVIVILFAIIGVLSRGETGFINEKSVTVNTSLDDVNWNQMSDLAQNYSGTDDLQIRSGTYQEAEENGVKSVTLIVDSDKKQASMEITYYVGDDNNDQSLTMNCVEPSLSKYPDTACDGVFNGVSTLEVVMGSDLPFYIRLSNGTTIVVEKGTDGTMHFLRLEGQFCGSDSLESEAISKAKKLIAENYDINADMFDYQTSDLCSDDGE